MPPRSAEGIKSFALLLAEPSGAHQSFAGYDNQDNYRILHSLKFT